MKKIIALLLVLVMSVMLFSACSDKKQDWDYIQSKGKLKIGVTVFQPMNYKDENNKWVGFETEFAQAVSAKLGVAVEFIIIDWDQKVMELNSKAIDCIWNGMTVTNELKEKIDISDSYIKNWQVLVIKKSNADKYTTLESMAGASVIAEAGSAGEKSAKADENLNQKLTTISTQQKALMEVKAGTSEIAIIDYVMAISTIKDETDYSDLMFVDGLVFAEEEYAIGLRKNSPETLAKINQAIKELTEDGTLNTLAEKYGIQDQLIINQK